jgi:hypothetical protein
MKSNPPICIHMPKTWKYQSYIYIDIFKWSQPILDAYPRCGVFIPHITQTNVISKGVLFEALALLVLELPLTYLCLGMVYGGLQSPTFSFEFVPIPRP